MMPVVSYYLILNPGYATWLKLICEFRITFNLGPLLPYLLAPFMNHQLLPDDELVRLMKISDEKALSEIYRRYSKLVFLAAYHRVRSKEAAQELVQNLFLRIWEKRVGL